LSFTEEKLKKLKISQAYKLFKMSQNVLKMLWCIENSKHSLKIACFYGDFFTVTLKTILSKIRFCAKIPVFPLGIFVFLGAFQNFCETQSLTLL